MCRVWNNLPTPEHTPNTYYIYINVRRRTERFGIRESIDQPMTRNKLVCAKVKKNWHFCTNWPIFRACNRLHDRRALVSWKYNMHPMVRPRHWQENSAFEYFEQSFYLLLTKKCNNTCSKKSSKMNYIMLDLYTFWMFLSYLFQQHSL